MKILTISLATLALFITITLPIQASAEEQTPPQTPPARNIPAKIRAELRSDLREKQDNLKTNQDIRNNILEKMMGSSTPRMMGGNASTTPRRNMMLNNLFQMRKTAIVHELQSAVNNLINVEKRLQSRIDKSISASSTRDMTAAKALLVTADAKIKIAQSAIDAIKNMTATSTITTASSTIDLERPRIIADGAKQAIKDAQKSLNDVVVAIAKAMGLKLGNDNNTENRSTTTGNRTDR